MCGRFVLKLDEAKIRQLCAYRDQKTNSLIIPEWIDVCKNKCFLPTYNMCPQMVAPVLVLEKYLSQSGIPSQKSKRVICPMIWGFIPSWYKGAEKSFKFSTINCRCETVAEKPMYKAALNKGRRCVVLAQGFYEWHKNTDGSKQPYFIYSKENLSNDDNNNNKTNDYEKLLALAAIFDIWTDENGTDLYKFSILTIDSKDSNIGWMHDRIPIILDTDEEIRAWLDSDESPLSEMNTLFKLSANLAYHPVSTSVNSIYNDSVENIKEISLEKPKRHIQRSLTSMLKKPSKSKKQEEDDDNDES